MTWLGRISAALARIRAAGERMDAARVAFEASVGGGATTWEADLAGPELEPEPPPPPRREVTREEWDRAWTKLGPRRKRWMPVGTKR